MAERLRMPESEIDLGALMLQRQAMYQFLARAFRSEVDQELLDTLARIDLAAETGVPEIDRGYRTLASWLMTVDDSTLAALGAEYARIMLGAGPSGGGGAFPYESVYTSPQGLLMQEARARVADLYRAEGLAGEPTEPEDHLALELEFVAHLCAGAARVLAAGEMEAAARNLLAQRAFLTEHLLNWAPRLCGDVARLATSDFYRAIADITSAYLVIDHDLLAGLLVSDETLAAC